METYTIAQVADMFQVDPRTVRRWIAEGKLDAFRIGRMIRIPKTALSAAMNAGV